MTPTELREVARAIVERTRAEQGLPPTVTDPGTLARLAVILAPVPAERRPPRKAAVGPPRAA